MTDEIDWREEIADYDANEVLIETRIMWLQLGRKCSDVVANCGDWIDTPEAADEAMKWAARAEACMWQATGDSAAINAERFIFPPAKSAAPEGQHD